MNKKLIIFIILISLIVAGGVFWWWESGKEPTPKPLEEMTPEELEKALKEMSIEELEREKARILEEILESVRWAEMTTTTAFEDQKVEGVIVTKKNDKKVIKNEVGGYEIEVPLNLMIARTEDSEVLKLYEPIEEGEICHYSRCACDVAILTYPDQNVSFLDEYVESWEKKISYFLEVKEKMIINNLPVYKIIPEGGSSIAYFFFNENTKTAFIIEFEPPSHNEYQKILESFTFK